jgi:predicted ATPase
MLREMAEALEALTTQMTLVLVLEDLHWSDRATLDLLALVAQRQESAGLLLIGTYRLGDVAMTGHPLLSIKQGLQVHGQCEELALRLLSQSAVNEYLAVRFPEMMPSAEAGQLIYEQTEGNPLFLVSVVDDCIARGVKLQDAAGARLQPEEDGFAVQIPDTLQQFVAQQIGRLSAEERVCPTFYTSPRHLG